jgi:hypothetical protein
MHNCPHKLVSKWSLMVPEPAPPLDIDEARVIALDVDNTAHRKFHRPIIDVDF